MSWEVYQEAPVKEKSEYRSWNDKLGSKDKIAILSAKFYYECTNLHIKRSYENATDEICVWVIFQTNF